MADEMREMRDLLIELRVNITHINNAIVDLKDDMAKRERTTDVRLSKAEERLAKIEQLVWYACGAVAILTPIFTYFIMKVSGQ